MKMQVLFSDIAKSGNHYEILDDSWLDAKELPRISPVEARISLVCQGESKVAVQGSLKTVIELVCDRCVNKFGYPVDVNFQLIVEVASDENWQVKELECTTTDLDTVVLAEPVVDLGDILRQQLYLMLPEKKICAKRCKGLCAHCGADLNNDACCCVADVKDSPFAVLAQLNKE